MSLLRAIILGCGSSGGIPRPGGPDGRGQWGDLDPENPKNTRMRCSLLVQRAHERDGWDSEALTTVLVDTSPDLHRQMLMARVTHIDAVFYTHDHADQCHGIDDLRVMSLNSGQRVPVYIDDEICPDLVTRFAYCFEQKPGSAYPAILDKKPMPPSGTSVKVSGPSGDIEVTPFLQEHGRINSLGFLFGGRGGIAYSSDANELMPESFDLLEGCGIWIADALRRTPHPSHAHLDKALGWLDRVQASRGVLTNMHLDMDYDTLCAELPENVRPAYDGMSVELETNSQTG